MTVNLCTWRWKVRHPEQLFSNIVNRHSAEKMVSVHGCNKCPFIVKGRAHIWDDLYLDGYCKAEKDACEPYNLYIHGSCSKKTQMLLGILAMDENKTAKNQQGQDILFKSFDTLNDALTSGENPRGCSFLLFLAHS